MSHINLDNIPTFAPQQPLLPDAGLPVIHPALSQSFNELLQQAQARPADTPAENTEAQSRPQPSPDANARSSSARNAAEERSAGEGDAEKAADDNRPPAESARPGGEGRKENDARDEETGTHKQEADAAANPEPHARGSFAKAEAGGKGGAAKSGEATRGEATAGSALDGANAVENSAAKADAKAAAAQKQPLMEQPVSTADPSFLTARTAGKRAAPTRSARGTSRAANTDENSTEQRVARPGNKTEEEGLAPLARRKQGGTEVPRANGPRHAEHREQKREGAAGHTNQALAERSAPEAKAAAPTAVKTDAVKIAPEQIASAPAEKAETPPVMAKPPSLVAAENQAALSARDGKNQSPRAGAPATSPKANESAQVDRVRFVQRVARAFQAVGDRGGTVRLRLSPPELGSLRVEVSVRHGTMTAQVHVEKASTRNLLLDNLSALRDRLAQQNIKIEQFHVDLLDYSPGGTSGGAADQAQSQDSGGGYLPPQASRDRTAAPASADPPGSARRPGEGTQLDVII